VKQTNKIRSKVEEFVTKTTCTDENKITQLIADLVAQDTTARVEGNGFKRLLNYGYKMLLAVNVVTCLQNKYSR